MLRAAADSGACQKFRQSDRNLKFQAIKDGTISLRHAYDQSARMNGGIGLFACHYLTDSWNTADDFETVLHADKELR